MINFIRISNNIKLGDFLHQDGIIDDIPSDNIIGVCVIPSNFLPDGRARFISMASMDARNKEKGCHEKERSMMTWFAEVNNHDCNFLVQRDEVPLDNNSDGVIDRFYAWGRVPLFEGFNTFLTIANPQDPWTKYYQETPYRIPSPYALDGSFNPLFHSKGSANALNDYRGDLNTREVVYSKKPKERCCPAFYCCERFSPGYMNNKWYLPAIGELAFIPPRLKIIRDKILEAINAGSPGVVLSTGFYSGYWSSTERSSGYAWQVKLGYGSVVPQTKNTANFVRAFISL